MSGSMVFDLVIAVLLGLLLFQANSFAFSSSKLDQKHLVMDSAFIADVAFGVPGDFQLESSNNKNNYDFSLSNGKFETVKESKSNNIVYEPFSTNEKVIVKENMIDTSKFIYYKYGSEFGIKPFGETTPSYTNDQNTNQDPNNVVVGESDLELDVIEYKINIISRGSGSLVQSLYSSLPPALRRENLELAERDDSKVLILLSDSDDDSISVSTYDNVDLHSKTYSESILNELKKWNGKVSEIVILRDEFDTITSEELNGKIVLEIKLGNAETQTNILPLEIQSLLQSGISKNYDVGIIS